MFEDEIQVLGKSVGLKGRFLVNWGFEDIKRAFKEKDDLLDRAKRLLAITSDYMSADIYETVVAECKEVIEQMGEPK